MEIKDCPEKKNPTDRPSQHSDYIDAADDEEEKPLHIVGYVTRSSIKCEGAQKAIKNAHQTTQQSKVISEANISESQFINNESLLYDTVDDYVEISSSEENNVPNSNPIKMRKTSSKCKCKKSAKQAKRVLPKRRKEKKLDETSLDSQPIKLRLMTCDSKMAYVDCETAKKIFEKESIFAFPLLEIRQVLQALQKADHFL